MSDQYAPPDRPGDPDGSLQERVLFWAGFSIWCGAFLVGAVGIRAYLSYRQVRDRIFNQSP